MVYVFLDTNIYCRILSQGKTGCELRHFNDLKKLVEGNVITLLVPEVILLELEKQNRTFAEDITNALGDIKKIISLNISWSEILDVKDELISIIQQKKQKKIEKWEENYTKISEFLKSDKTEVIEFNADLLCNGKSRLIAARMPINKDRSEQDALIIESLVTFFKQSNSNDKELIFCSENYTDFAVEEKPKAKDRVFHLHPLIQNDLPQSQYFIDLDSMLKFTKGYEAHLQKSTNQEITVARQKVEELEEEGIYDFESDDYCEASCNLQELIHKEASQQFKNQILPTVSTEIQQERQNLSEIADQLLIDCRGCKAWDDTSEEKLPQWIENVREEMIPFTSLANLVRININLKKYLEIHKK